MKIPERITATAFDAWARTHGVGAVYLFGSTARGTARPDSDVDIGLWLTRAVDWYASETTREKAVAPLARALDVPEDRLDVRVINDAPLAFQFRVIRPHRCIWESDHSARIRFEVDTLQEYYDFRHYEDMYHATMRRQLLQGEAPEPSPILCALREMQGHVERLKLFPRANMLADRLRVCGVFYALQCAIEGLISTGHHLVAEYRLQMAESHGELPQILAANRVIADAGRVERMIDVRGLLVHGVEMVEPSMVMDIVDHHLGDFATFAGDVERWIEARLRR